MQQERILLPMQTNMKRKRTKRETAEKQNTKQRRITQEASTERKKRTKK